MSEVFLSESEFALDREEFKWEFAENELCRYPQSLLESGRHSWPNSEFETSQIYKTRLGFNFHIALYPNGIRDDSEGHISLYLRLVNGDPQSGSLPPEKKEQRSWVHAKFQFFLNTENGNIATSASLTKPNKFETHTGQYSWGYPKFCKTSELFRSSGRHEKFEIRCVVEQYTDLKELLACRPREASAEDLNELQKHMGQLLKSGQQSDLRVKINNVTYDLHQCVLQCRSPEFLKKLLQSRKDCEHEVEAKDEMVELNIENVTNRDVRKLLSFIYSNDLLEVEATTNESLALVHMSQLFHLPDLESLALKMLQDNLTAVDAVDLLLHPLTDPKVQTIALKKMSTKPRTLYEHSKYEEIHLKRPDLVAELFDLVADRMIEAKERANLRSEVESDGFSDAERARLNY